MMTVTRNLSEAVMRMKRTLFFIIMIMTLVPAFAKIGWAKLCVDPWFLRFPKEWLGYDVVVAGELGLVRHISAAGELGCSFQSDGPTSFASLGARAYQVDRGKGVFMGLYPIYRSAFYNDSENVFNPGLNSAIQVGCELGGAGSVAIGSYVSLISYHILEDEYRFEFFNIAIYLSWTFTR